MSEQETGLVAEMPSLVQRGIVYLVGLILVMAMALLYFGRASVVVNATGRIVPEGDLVLVQARQRGVVKSVLAKPGDRLPKGTPLIGLDLGDSGMTLTELEQKRAAQTEQLATMRATVDLIAEIVADPDRALEATRTKVVATVGKTVETINELENAKAKADAARAAMESWPSRKGSMLRELELTRENLRINETNYESQARLLKSSDAALEQKRRQLEGYQRLAERRLLSALELGAEEEKFRGAESAAAETRRRIEQMAIDISNQKIKVAELEGRIAGEPGARQGAYRQAQNSMRQILAVLSENGENLRNQIREGESALATTDARIVLAKSQATQASVVMPVAGVVAELKVSNGGEVVSDGQLVATIVPEGVPLIVEAAVPNRDVGFVRVGIEGRVKVDAYPFQQFGTLPARVRTVLPGLGRDNNFTVRLELLQDHVSSADGPLPLFPGLTVEAELMTARQRLLYLILNPGSAARSNAR